MSTKISVKRNPLFLGHKGLDFGEDVMELSDSQKSDKFMSQWMGVFKPFGRYANYLKNSGKDKAVVFREIKNYFKRYVLTDGWSEMKYVMVIDSILESGSMLIPVVIEKFGESFDNGRLSIQVTENRIAKRNRI